MNTNHFDLICLGGGSGGIATAKRAAEYGAKVLLVESGRLGGTCVNVGCVPKKISWHAAQLAEQIRLSKEYGFGELSTDFNWAKFVDKRDAFILKLNGLYAKGLQKNNIKTIDGYGKFIDNKTISVGDNTFTAGHIVIAVGGKPFIPKTKGATIGGVSDDFFEMKKLPKSIAIAGAGYIAVELAGVMNALGVDTHLIVRGDKLIKFVDQDIAEQLTKQMQHDGVQIHFKEEIFDVSEIDAVSLTLKSSKVINVERLIWATGRVPNIENLGLDKTDIVIQQNGKISVDSFQNTAVKGLYALGDITDQPELTPAAIEAGRHLANRLFNNQAEAKADFTFVPTVIFSHPPIGTVGMSETEAKEVYGETSVKTYCSTFNPLLRSMAEEKVPTVMKMICNTHDNERVVGLHIIGDFADEVIQGFAVAVQMGATKSEFDKTLAIHPTSGEEFVTMR